MYSHFSLRSHILVVALACILSGYSSSCGQTPPSLEWPDKVYHLITIDNAVEVTGDSLLTGEHYLAVDASYSPMYFPGNISGNIQDLLTASADQPDRPLIVPTTDTVTLRIICKTENRANRPVGSTEEMSMAELMEYLQVNIKELYLGKFLDWYVSTNNDSVLNRSGSSMPTEFGALANMFPRVNRDTVTVIMHEHYASGIAADTNTNIIRISPDAFYNESILLHELGHIWGLCHPETCCNLCECYQDHFMYDCAMSGVGQIMIRDWLVIVNECACEDVLCNSCSREACVDDRGVTALLSSIDRIEFEAPSVNLENITEEELFRTYQMIGERDSLREMNHENTHRYLVMKYKPSKIKLSARGYADFKTRGRRKLRLVRYISVLESLIAQDSTNVEYQKLMVSAKESLQTGMHVKHSPDTK